MKRQTSAPASSIRSASSKTVPLRLLTFTSSPLRVMRTICTSTNWSFFGSKPSSFMPDWMRGTCPAWSAPKTSTIRSKPRSNFSLWYARSAVRYTGVPSCRRMTRSSSSFSTYFPFSWYVAVIRKVPPFWRSAYCAAFDSSLRTLLALLPPPPLRRLVGDAPRRVDVDQAAHLARRVQRGLAKRRRRVSCPAFAERGADRLQVLPNAHLDGLREPLGLGHLEVLRRPPRPATLGRCRPRTRPGTRPRPARSASPDNCW